MGYQPSNTRATNMHTFTQLATLLGHVQASGATIALAIGASAIAATLLARWL